jgi:hypothetical protein
MTERIDIEAELAYARTGRAECENLTLDSGTEPTFAAGVDVPLGPVDFGVALAGIFEFRGNGGAYMPSAHAGYSW